MNLSHAVAAIQSLVGSVKGVQILYSEKVQNSNMSNFSYIAKSFYSVFSDSGCVFFSLYILGILLTDHPQSLFKIRAHVTVAEFFSV
jgi:hypothetical protein